MKRWKKILAAVTAGVLCVGSVGVTGLQDILESIVLLKFLVQLVPTLPYSE